MQDNFFPSNPDQIAQELNKSKLLEVLQKMLLIRHFEIRGEAAYQHGKVGGFFHSYIGQEAIQTAAVLAFGPEQWYITSYRCHALALLLGATPEELMAELYGKATGNAKGRGGSMHFFTDRLMGGFGIVASQTPVANGAAFAIKYLNEQKVSICFLGEGAMAQGAFHESLNLASLWSLPTIFIIENNQWGMGTYVEKAVAAKRLAEDVAPAYRMKGYTVDGMDFFNCFACFSSVLKETLSTSRPCLIEAKTQRFKGHSISDPGFYRTKESLKKEMERDPLFLLKNFLEKKNIIDEKTFEKMDEEAKNKILLSMKYAEESPWPDPLNQEKEVFKEEN